MRNHLFRKSVPIVLALAFTLAAAQAFAANFHINAGADSLSNKQAEAYKGSSVTAVTQALGSPSMVRDNTSDSGSMDYIYIGRGKVCTFVVSKEAGKPVTDSKSYSRGQWESGIYPAYPA